MLRLGEFEGGGHVKEARRGRTGSQALTQARGTQGRSSFGKWRREYGRGCLQRWPMQNENVRPLVQNAEKKMTWKVLIHKLFSFFLDRSPIFSFLSLLFFSLPLSLSCYSLLLNVGLPWLGRLQGLGQTLTGVWAPLPTVSVSPLAHTPTGCLSRCQPQPEARKSR